MVTLNEHNQIKNIYLANGLDEYKVTKHQDIFRVHGIKVEEISGYKTLSKIHKDFFDNFIINFFNAQGLERRSELIPISINYVKAEEYLGKLKDADDFFIPLGGKLTALLGEEQIEKVLCTWKDTNYKKLPRIETERQEYLRFDYRNGRQKEWQHVISDNQWY